MQHSLWVTPWRSTVGNTTTVLGTDDQINQRRKYKVCALIDTPPRGTDLDVDEGSAANEFRIGTYKMVIDNLTKPESNPTLVINVDPYATVEGRTLTVGIFLKSGFEAKQRIRVSIGTASRELTVLAQLTTPSLPKTKRKREEGEEPAAKRQRMYLPSLDDVDMSALPELPPDFFD